ncbi:Eco57I restriction-modification methylase domain-containing protein [Murdochiella massiliensis]|uniref:Eco57I restriction-modification methylase domain-containing protein n=1 Tax=Murdochiella massiliensis TaxID=1673723 RepID=UPI00082EDB26|nr:Eco57I restriction-modification methylase domain-containing protein [Murdochiella massiliensis]
MIENIEILDNLIVGRVAPHIYAFSTNTVPNYLKVGDTYRPVSTRLHEWRQYFPDLTKDFDGEASVSEDVYFRDFAVHQFLEQDLKKVRLLPTDLSGEVYYSKEFFKETKPDDVQQAIDDIKESYENNDGKYAFYDASRRLPEEYHYVRGPVWPLRPNQQAAVEAFRNAINAGRRNLLMYAVMRFGKTFTSLCCAVEMDARLVLVVSAKADVAEEWKKTVETAGNFKDYEFFDSSSLSRDEHILAKTLSEGKRGVIFLTLQDLQGEQVKEKHKEIFEHNLDMVIVDETHFGARAASYGKILSNIDPDLNKDVDDDSVSLDDADVVLKQLHANVQLHLSGTPYRILMGSEFEPEDIIAFVQFTDIVREQKDWDEKHLADDNTNEWDNPYFGFPEMIRFAFHPNASSMKKMEELSKQGVKATMSALFKPLSTKKDAKTNGHKKFRFEKEILDLLRVIDGTQEDENLLGFLDYDKLKEGKMCRHLVMILPYRASCDALESLIDRYHNEFKNLGSYRIINISGVDGTKTYKHPADVKRIIRECEEQDQKTMTLTVNRMLTGSTVEQWDTMLYFKDTASPQEYDQSIFRLQNQYTRELRDADGHVIKENMKPQTLLVDFDPMRLFRMQEQKALIYNANVDKGGNAKLKQRIEDELRISPVVLLNHGKIHQIEATDIMEEISAYHNNRSVNDEVVDIPVDMGLLDDPHFKALIDRQGEFGSKTGMTLSPAKGEGEDLEIPEDRNADKPDQTLGTGDDDDEPPVTPPVDKKEEQSLEKKIQTFYQRILFYAFLTPDQVSSVQDIVDHMDEDPNPRIAKNLSLNRSMLEALLREMNPFFLSKLDYKVQNISTLAHDVTLTPLVRAKTSLAKFSRMSESEVITPEKVSQDMVALLPEAGIRAILEERQNFFDIGGKAGEYPLALFVRLTEELGYSPESIQDRIYSIPTSPIAYEFTRKFYETLGLNTKNIARAFNAYDLLNVKDDHDDVDYEKVALLITQNKPFEAITMQDIVVEGEKTVEFGAVVGNPPYQESDGGYAASSMPVYQHFVEISKNCHPNWISLIIPARWYIGGRGLDSFRISMLADKHISYLIDYPHDKDVFPSVDVAGGVCYFLWGKEHQGDCVVINNSNGEVSRTTRSLNEFPTFIRDNRAVEVVRKVQLRHRGGYMDEVVYPSRPFGLRTYYQPKSDGIPCQFIQRIGKRFADPQDVKDENHILDKWKFLVPKAPIAGQTDFTKQIGFYYSGNTFIAEPDCCCTESFLVAFAADTEQEVLNFKSYLFTRIVRFLLLQSVISQDVVADKWKFVPNLQQYNQQYSDELLMKLWGITAPEMAYIQERIKEVE